MTNTGLLRRGIYLEYLTLGWNVVGVVIVAAGALRTAPMMRKHSIGVPVSLASRRAMARPDRGRRHARGVLVQHILSIQYGVSKLKGLLAHA
jgi:hypothetical protein